ncbi:MAG: SDR family NAD(P)-dependent oxidoreductase, partial [Acidobacteria bacterium]|nr:SDR family NAD(P)-dependent oxidoreductase [Acidobacteriota bacterium]
MTYKPLELGGKVVVVIGGTSGIGRAIAHGLAEAGADVVPTSRRDEQVEAAAHEIEAIGRRSLRVASDVADRASLQRVLDESVRAFGKVDILVNSAGKTKRAPTLDFPEEDWADIIETNLTGTLRACQVFGRHMLEREYGRIINIASLSTFVALYEVAAYSASKAAVASLTKSLAVEWSPRGVNVNAIAPGVFRTALNQKLLDESDRGREFLTRTPMRRFGRVEE